MIQERMERAVSGYGQVHGQSGNGQCPISLANNADGGYFQVMGQIRQQSCNFEQLIARDMLQRSNVPLMWIGLNNIDTEDIAARKGRQWGIMLHESAKKNAALLHKAGAEDMTELNYREMISIMLQKGQAKVRTALVTSE